MDMSLINQQLVLRAEEIARMLYSEWQEGPHEWKLGDVYGNRGESLKLAVSGQRRGKWIDFANSDHRGDLIDLWCHARAIEPSQARAEAMDYLGIKKQEIASLGANKAYSKPCAAGIEIKETESKVFKYLREDRKISHNAIKKYKLAEDGDDIVFNSIKNNQVVHWKKLSIHRDIKKPNKKKISTSKDSEPCLFGWQSIDSHSRILVIAEGEIDALSLFDYGFPAVSVPFGTSNFDWIDSDYELLENYDEIYLCLDNDDSGKKATAECVLRLGAHRCRIVSLPFKDANDCLRNNVSCEVIRKCFDEASFADVEALIRPSSLIDYVNDKYDGVAKGVHGYRSLLSSVKKLIPFCKHELTIFTGRTGQGKTQFLNQLMLDFMTQGARICMASMEMSAGDLAYAFTRLASGMKSPSRDYRVNILDWLDSKLWFYNLVGAAKIEMILETFDYAYKRFGVDVFVIDSLMMCSMKTDDYNSQHEFVLSLIEFVTKRDIHIFLVAHASKGDKNKPNESVGIDGVKGASEIVNLGHHVLTIKRVNEDVEGVSAWFEQIKGRALDSWLGSKPLHFDPDSTQFLAFPQDKPRKYVEFSVLNK